MRGGVRSGAGGPEQEFATDPDRYIIGQTDGLLIAGICSSLRLAQTVAISFHQGSCAPKTTTLTSGQRRLWKAGGAIVQLESPALVEPVRNRINKKAKRIGDRQDVRRWRYYMGRSWACLLTRPNAADLVGFISRIGEEDYLRGVMLGRWTAAALKGTEPAP